MKVFHIKIKNYILKRRHSCLLIGILFLGGIIRLWHIGFSDFWFDEVVSLHMAKDFNTLLKISYDPFLYYNILALWIRLFGLGEEVVRSLSTFFDIGSILLLYLIGKEILDRKTALLTAFFYCLAPLPIWYAREARNYSLCVLLGLLIFYFFIRATTRNDKNIFWLLLCLSMILSMYTTYFSFIILFVCLALILVLPNYRKFFKKMVLVSFVAIIAFSPYMTIFWGSFAEITDNFWIPKPTVKQLLITLENFNLGYTISTWGYGLSHLFFTLPFIIGLISLLKRKQSQVNLLLGFLFIPILSTYAISQKFPIYLDRKLLICSPFYYLILAYGIRVRKLSLLRFVIVASAIILILVSIFGLYNGFLNENYMHHVGVHPKRPISNVVNYVNTNFREGDIIAHTNYSTTFPFHWYGVKVNGSLGDYFRKGNRGYFFYTSANISDYWLTRIKAGKVPEIVIDTQHTKNLNRYFNRGIWLLQSDWAHSGVLDSESEAVRHIISSRYILIHEKLLDGILVSYYKTKEPSLDVQFP